MNVSGVGAPATPAAASVPAPSPTDRAPTEAAKAAHPDGSKTQHKSVEEEAPKLPPLKGLTLTEVRVMLGVMPASAAIKQAQQPTHPGAFDVYA
ncbi:MAG TPA: hypothetical protein VFP72_10540 [Kineosporiaceae bacterium]|nr:hypothetical protein [Kineosporiaceae bacterium]